MLPTKLDRSGHLTLIRANIERIGALFKEFAVVVGTPDDEGVQKVHEWAEEAKAGKCTQVVCNPAQCIPSPCPGNAPGKAYEVFVTTEEKNSKVDCSKWVFYNTVGKITKACKIAKGRDAILDNLFQQHKGKYDYAIAVDSDMTKQWSTKSFLKAFSLDSDWGMIAANGVGPVTHDHQEWFAWASNRKYKIGHSFGVDEPAIQVKSAFGGIGIYRTELLEKCRYAACGGGCEHACLEKCMRLKQQAKIYMVPGFVVEWPVHKIEGVKATDDEKLKEVSKSWDVSEPSFAFQGRIPK